MVETKSPKLRQSSSKKFGLCVVSNSTLHSLIENNNLIEPSRPEMISCSGVDLRLGDEYYLLRSLNKVFDTHKKNSPRFYYRKSKNSELLINSNDRYLVCTIERINMPKDLIGLVGLRSSYSRLGLQMPLGFIDPGFVGQLTMEISGGTFPVLLHSGDRVFHVIFAALKEASETAYNGRYQNQKGVTLPIFPEKH